MKKRPANWKPRIPKDATITHIAVPHQAVDDYDLPAEIEFDYSKAKPNPYAGRVQFTHGGARKGAGRKPTIESAEPHTVSLYKADVKFLRSLDRNLSRAIRKLIAASKR
jgi:hypothetical protein